MPTQTKKWEEEFDLQILSPLRKGWGIHPKQVLAIKYFISFLLSQKQEEILKAIDSVKLVGCGKFNCQVCKNNKNTNEILVDVQLIIKDILTKK